MDLFISLLVHKDGKHAPVWTSLTPQVHSQTVEASSSQTACTEDRDVPLNRVGPAVTMDEHLPLPFGQRHLISSLSKEVENVPPSDCQHPQHVLDNLFSLDEWDKMHPPPSPTPKVFPLPPVKTHGEHAAQFNTLCQRHGLSNEFTFREFSKGCFSAKVTFGPHIVENQGPFSSKKEAKDTICRQANSELQVLPAPAKATKRKSSDGSSPETGNKAMIQDEEDWVSLLQEFCQQSRTPRLTYTYYEADTRSLQKQGLSLANKQFACTVHVSQTPLLTSGSKEALFTSKTEAKRYAAKDAVLCLRANGHILESRKRRKSVNDATPGHTGLTQAVAITSVNGDVALTYAQRVHEKSLALGFSQPRYESRPSVLPAPAAPADVGAFVNMAAFYNDQDVEREPRLAGPVGEVRHVFGKKNAKEMCCKEVMLVLDRIEHDRVRVAEGVVSVLRDALTTR